MIAGNTGLSKRNKRYLIVQKEITTPTSPSHIEEPTSPTVSVQDGSQLDAEHQAYRCHASADSTVLPNYRKELLRYRAL